MEATNPYPLFDGPAFKSDDDTKRVLHIKSKIEIYNSELAKGELKTTVLAVIALAIAVLSGGFFLWGAYGILTAAVSLTTVGMGDAAIKLLASLVFLFMAGSAATRALPQKQLNLADSKNWEKIHQWLSEYGLYRQELEKAGLTINLLKDIGFLQNIKPYQDVNDAGASAKYETLKNFHHAYQVANTKLSEHQATLLNH